MNNVDLKITISEETYKKLKEQLESLKNSKDTLGGNDSNQIDTVEELVQYYLFQITVASEEMNQFQFKISDVVATLKEKGINFEDILKMFKTTMDKKPKEKEEEKEENSIDSDHWNKKS